MNTNYLMDPLITHEVAHQWWYNVVGNNVIDDPWLDEALATYSYVIYLEEAEGMQAGRGAIDYFEKEYRNG